ncbi:MAG TPA: aminotransferase class V-fold PLP-dependent enzyme, partial [Dongiaceae bacterium]|nr:aminotransferase class V-fold PLP-dependent enzyme [Dongiaceae bacterium]
MAPAHDPWLLTPGPLTTSLTVKQAMLHDWGSRDAKFVAINNRMRQRLVALIDGGKDFTCVPMQGSGTFAVEAMLTSFVGPKDKLLILINGAYGKRMAKICEYARRATAILEWAEDQPVDPAKVRDTLAADKAITHVAIVHCETTSGILNPIAEVSQVVAEAGRKLLIDSMSAFGALPVDANSVTFDALAA